MYIKAFADIAKTILKPGFKDRWDIALNVPPVSPAMQLIQKTGLIIEYVIFFAAEDPDGFNDAGGFNPFLMLLKVFKDVYYLIPDCVVYISHLSDYQLLSLLSVLSFTFCILHIHIINAYYTYFHVKAITESTTCQDRSVKPI